MIIPKGLKITYLFLNPENEFHIRVWPDVFFINGGFVGKSLSHRQEVFCLVRSRLTVDWVAARAAVGFVVGSYSGRCNLTLLVPMKSDNCTNRSEQQQFNKCNMNITNAHTLFRLKFVNKKKAVCVELDRSELA